MVIEEEITEIRQQLTEIKTALVGNDFNKKQAMKNRLEDVEDRLKQIELFKIKAISFILGLSFVVSILWNIFIEILKQKI